MLALASAAVGLYFAAPMATATAAAVCYKLPFNNPTLSDGWGSTCCGRTSPHRGVDFPQAAGTSIPAAAAGKVVVNTWNGCLGNVIVLEHADGMYSGYSHMSAASSLKKGATVKIGQTLGKVGKTGSCSKGAHLHLTMSPTAGGYASGTTVDPYKYIQQHKTCNTPAKGKLEHVGCQTLSGWAQDPDDPKVAVSTRLYFDGPAGDEDAGHATVVADVKRDDLCEPLKSCKHGFEVRSPLSLFDGATHKVYAYAIDTDSKKKIELSSSPRKMTCALALQGQRRLIADADALAAWRFSSLFDTLTLADGALGALEETIALPPAPLLVRADDESPEVWLIDGPDGELRRQVPGAEVAEAWRLDLKSAVVWPAATLAALQEAPPLRPRPVVVKGSGAARYLLDVRLFPDEAGESSGAEGSTSGEVETGEAEDTGDGGSSGGEGSSSGGGSSSGEAPPVDSSSSGEPADSGGPPGAALPGSYGLEDGCDCRSGGAPGAWFGAAALLLLLPRRRGMGRVQA